MELRQLRTFRVLAETLSFTRTAERLRLTQSAVSHQIKSLEEELGEPLFLRTNRGVRISEAGQAALEFVERILNEAELLRERVGRGQRDPFGRVRVAAATQAFVHLFAPLFNRFLRAYPGIELTFRTTASTDQTVADILNGVADVGFASLPLSSPALRVTRLFEDELLLVVGKGHRLARQEFVEVADLKAERLILLERGASIRRVTDRFFDGVGFQPELALESNDIDFIKLMVAQGLGITLLPVWAARDEVAVGTLAQLGISGHRLRRQVSMISLSRFQPLATRTFLSFMVEHKAELEAAGQVSPATTPSDKAAVPGAVAPKESARPSSIKIKDAGRGRSSAS
jgi:DNA-binding transcriptional LysR family regulator